MITVLYFKPSDDHPSRQKFLGFSRKARQNKWRVQTVHLNIESAANIPRLLRFWKASCAVIDCGTLVKLPSQSSFGNVPVIFLGRHPRPGESISTVREDTKSTAEFVSRELLSLGYLHYAYVPHLQKKSWSDLRGSHFKELVRMHGCRYHQFKRAADTRGDSLSWNMSLRRWIKALPKPCGIFAATDFVAAKIIDICSSERIAIPGKIALIGVDNDEAICLSTKPRLSSVLPDYESAGILAARMASALLHSPKAAPFDRLVKPLMVVRRDSTRLRATPNERLASAIALIRQKSCEGLRARDVIAHIGGSRRSAELHFRLAFGHSILHEIQTVRMERAKELFSDSSRPVKIIANMCGYSSVASFLKIYKNFEGR